MAILICKAADAPVADSPSKWRVGEVVSVVDNDFSFGWYEMPIQWQGEFTVAQVNAASPSQYEAVRVTDAGTVTNGSENVDVSANDVIVWQWGKFVNFGPRADVPANFYHIFITDKTKAQVQSYIQGWSHDPTTQQISASGDDRRIRVTSTVVSVTGKNAFTQAGVEALMADIGGTYVTHTNTSFDFDITATIEERDEIIDKINEAVRNMQYNRRRWRMTDAGIAYCQANGGMASGPAATVATYLHDKLLD